MIGGAPARAMKKGVNTVRTAASKAPIRGIKKRAKGALPPVAGFVITPLDPIQKCGAATSVQRLYLVRETIEGKTRSHLVFFDRHGWYCEHGRSCPAVAPARKQKGHIARVS